MRGQFYKIANFISVFSLWCTTTLILFLAQYAFLKDILKVPSYTIGPFYLYEIAPLIVSVLIVSVFCKFEGPFKNS